MARTPGALLEVMVAPRCAERLISGLEHFQRWSGGGRRTEGRRRPGRSAAAAGHRAQSGQYLRFYHGIAAILPLDSRPRLLPLASLDVLPIQGDFHSG